MTDPVSIALVAGAGFSALNQISGAQAQASSLRRQARGEEQAAAFDASQFARQESATRGQARAARGASGVGFTGSALMVDEASVRQAAIQESNIRRGGRMRAQTRRREAGIAERAGRARAFNTLLSAGSTFATSGAAPVQKKGS